MQEYRQGSHTKFSIHLHVVWVTKYRKPILQKEIALYVRDVIWEECQKMEVDILKGHVSKDHVHLMLSIPPQVTISWLVQQLKGKSSFKVFGKFEKVRKQYWGRHLWARGYFVRSSGNVTNDVIKAYIENQSHDDEFKVGD